MNCLKKLLFTAGTAAILLTGIALVTAPPAEAAATAPEDCTFCSSYLQHCGVWNVYRICYTKMSGPGTCPPCTGCLKMNIDH